MGCSGIYAEQSLRRKRRAERYGLFMVRRNKALFLVAILLVSTVFFAACGKDETDDKTSKADISDQSEFPYSGHFGGQTIRIFCVDTERHAYGTLQFVPDDEKAGNVVNDAVAARNDLIEEKYGLKIEAIPAMDPAFEVKNLIAGGVCDYDIVVDSVDRMVTSVTENLYWSVDDILDLDNDWWDFESISSLTLNDKHYFVAGNALITDDDHTYLTLFNKKMYEEQTALTDQFGDIYDLVREGKFTLDAFAEMCKIVSHADESGSWGFYATYGNLSHGYGATIMVNGAGVALAEKTADGSVVLNPGTNRAVTVFDKVYDIMSDKSITQRAELIIGQGTVTSKWGFSELQAMFEAGRGLFYNTTSSTITRLKQNTTAMGFDFGVLPIPKFDEEQDKYYSAVNRYHSSVIGIPSSNTQNKAATAFLLEALGYYSGGVTEAYYKITLQLQAVTDDDDADMLDIIYSSRFYDIGAIYSWGSGDSLVGLYTTVIRTEGTNTLTSVWESMRDSVEADMQATLEEYRNNLT